MERDTALFIVAFIGAVGSGMVAGVLFAFSSFVMPALARLSPPEGIRAMQAINVTAVTPAFMALFGGTTAISLLAAVVAIVEWGAPGANWVLAGGLVFFAGTFVLTGAFHIPRNNALAAVQADSEEGHRTWASYLRQWVAGNHVRTLAAAIACACFIVGMTSN